MTGTGWQYALYGRRLAARASKIVSIVSLEFQAEFCRRTRTLPTPSASSCLLTLTVRRCLLARMNCGSCLWISRFGHRVATTVQLPRCGVLRTLTRHAPSRQTVPIGDGTTRLTEVSSRLSGSKGTELAFCRCCAHCQKMATSQASRKHYSKSPEIEPETAPKTELQQLDVAS